MRVINVGGTWFGGLSFVAHFGLGQAQQADTVRVEWPSGAVQELSQVAPNRYLTVQETVINLQASDTEPLPGQSVTLQILTPVAGATYQWRLDGMALPGATGATLTLTNVSAANMGQYTIVATRLDSDLGAPVATVSLPIQLKLATKPVVGAPVFTPGSVSLGATVTNQAAVSGKPPLSYQWQLNGVDIPASSNPTATNPTLIVTNVAASDAGFYRLVASNALGLTIGPEAKLEVDTTFTKITSGPIVTDAAFPQFGHVWTDYDGDGAPDLIISSAGILPSGLPYLALVVYRNEGGGLFTRHSQSFPDASGIPLYYITRGDYDNDGYPDLFVPNWSRFGGLPGNNVLLHNERDGTFSQVTNSAPAQEGTISNGAAWGDSNGSGWLDLFVVNGVDQNRWLTAPHSNWMYRNQGNGSFLKLTAEQVGPPLQDVNPWAQVCWADVDDDGWPDLLVTSGTGPPHLYGNTGAESFTSVVGNPIVTEANAAIK